MPHKLLFGKEKETGVRIIGYSLLSLWALVVIFVIYKMFSSLPLSKKIQKISQKIAQIDKEIAEELKNSNL